MTRYNEDRGDSTEALEEVSSCLVSGYSLVISEFSTVGAPRNRVELLCSVGSPYKGGPYGVQYVVAQ